ncbi:MAG: hypothetical protein IT435_02555 [Phycisphaerales bacterium]|nr:hypothetical protein [Phycisphaerales bacterium]
MRVARIVLPLAVSLLLGGCIMPVKPARTEVKPGESEIKSEREERRPSESTMKIKATTPAPHQCDRPEPSPTVIRVIVTPPK